MKVLLRRYHATPFRLRVALGAFILGAILVAVVVQVTVKTSEQGLLRQFDERAEALLDVATAMSLEPLLTAEYAQHNELMQRLGTDENVQTLDLINVAGQIVSSNDPSRVGLADESSVAQLIADEQHPIVVTPVVAVSGEIGTVRAVLDKSAVDRLLAAQRRRALYSGILGVTAIALVSMVGGWALTRRVTGLVSQLGDTDEHGLPGPVRIEGSDEIARLGAALNQRTVRIREVVDANTQARDQLELSEAKLQLALAAAADAVVEVDLVGDKLTIVGNSTAGRRLDGAETTEVQQLKDWVHPDDRELVKRTVARAISGLAAPQEIAEIEVRVRDLEPRWRNLVLRIYAIGEPGGPSTRVLIAIVDVTERRLTERHLAKSDTMRTIGQLTAGIAHDFNNALAVSRLQLSVLKRPDRDRSRDDERIQQLIVANNNGTSMVQRLLRSAAPQLASPTRVNIVDLVESLGGLLRTILGADIALVVDAMGDHHSVEVDVAATQQVFMNLAKNAADAIVGIGQLTVRIWNPSATAIAIEVSDTGPGIDPSVAETLFDPFVTTKPAGAGTGLGLATSFETIRAAGGTITASNHDQGGASFSIVLPVAEQPDPRVEAEPGAGAAHSSAIRRILLVDDNTALLGSLTDLLADAGYEVSAATCSRDAMQLVADAAGFDLVLSDVGLPDGSGFDLCRDIERAYPNIRTLCMSALPDSKRAVQADHRVCLQKPFEDETVLAAVASALQPAVTRQSSSPSN